MILGITGGIGTGKTTASNVIAAQGVRIIDCDEISHYLTAYDPTVITAIREHFGSDVFSKHGSLNRTAIATVVFNDEQERRALERILHPPIKAAVQANIELAQSMETLLVVVAPLLIEAGMTMYVDRLWVITCSSEIQLDRLCLRAGISREDASKWVDAQMPLDEKEKYADVVISNNGIIDDLVSSVKHNWQEFIEQA